MSIYIANIKMEKKWSLKKISTQSKAKKLIEKYSAQFSMLPRTQKEKESFYNATKENRHNSSNSEQKMSDISATLLTTKPSPSPITRTIASKRF